MKAILMSIKPKWCELIFSGEKTIEVRKTAPKLKPPFKVYMYETQGATVTPWVDEDGHFIFKGRGQVVGEFVCDEKYDIHFAGASYMINNDISLTNGIARQSCLWYDDMLSYLGVKGGAALHITKPKRYDTPKELEVFSRYGYKKIEHKGSGYVFCDNTQCRYCEPDEGIAGLYRPPVCRKGGCKITRPPQSFMYVEEIKE